MGLFRLEIAVRCALAGAAAVLLAACGTDGPASLSSGTGQGTVQTNRPDTRALAVPAEKDAFQFVIFGDRTGGPAEGIEVLKKAVGEVNLLDPDLVMTVGDLVQGYNDTPEWLAQMREYRAVMNGLRMPWYPVAGNHDVYWRGKGKPPQGHHEHNYETHFGPLWYWFPHKNAVFIVLYSDEGDPETNKKGWGRGLNRMRSGQLAWLRETLKQTAAADHVFVFLHHPRWRERLYRGSNWDAVHGMLARAGNVRAVFAGHRHRRRYDGVRDGIAYYTLATVGGHLRADAPAGGWLHHMDVVTVRKTGIEVATLPVGSVLDPKAMTPDHLADIDRARKLPLVRQPDPIRLRADGSGDGELRYRLRNTASGPLSVTLSASGMGWAAIPERSRIELAPGDTGDVGIRLRRAAGPGGPKGAVPNATLQIDYRSKQGNVRFVSDRIAPVYAAKEQPARGAKRPPRYAAFDGTGGGIRLPSDDVSLPDGPFTLEAWIRPDGVTRARFIAAKGAMAFTGQRGEYHLILVRGRPQFMVRLDFARYAIRAAAPLAPGVWHHVAGVYDGNEIRLYVSGKRIKSLPASGTRVRNTMPFIVGAGPQLRRVRDSAFDGGIDEVRLSTIARYAGPSVRVSRKHDRDSDTFLLLNFDQQRSPIIRDASGNRRHGIVAGTTMLQQEGLKQE